MSWFLLFENSFHWMFNFMIWFFKSNEKLRFLTNNHFIENFKTKDFLRIIVCIANSKNTIKEKIVRISIKTSKRKSYIAFKITKFALNYLIQNQYRYTCDSNYHIKKMWNVPLRKKKKSIECQNCTNRRFWIWFIIYRRKKYRWRFKHSNYVCLMNFVDKNWRSKIRNFLIKFFKKYNQKI